MTATGIVTASIVSTLFLIAVSQGQSPQSNQPLHEGPFQFHITFEDFFQD
jgi:hypothetical protein